MAKSNFIVRGGADFSGIKREMDKTQKQFKGFKGNLMGGLKAFGAMAGLTLGAKALYDFGKASLKVASDLEEIQNVVDVTFGAMSKDIDDFSKTLIDSHGLGELSAKKYASYMGAMLKSSGIHGDIVKDMSMDFTKLTADMASFYNLETEEMFQKIMSGMTGATMPLKQLGINMNIANLEAFALSQGIRSSWQEMSQAEQTMLRYNYLLNVTSDSQGDFARNSWNWGHSLKILNEKWKEFMGLVGTGLKEVLLPLLQVLIKIVDFLIATAEALGRIYTMITGKQIISETKGSIADSNFDIGSSADDAAKSEKDLGKGIDKAAKAAKKALAPFDELNILQNNLNNSGNGGGGSDIGVKGGDFNTSFNTQDIGDGLGNGLKKVRDEGEEIYLWLEGRDRDVRDLFEIPVMVPAPVFASIPLPIYQPEWGLTPPLVPVPVFNPILNPVYQPNWGLEVPKVARPVFSPIPNRIYEPNWGLELPKIPIPVFPAIERKDYDTSLEKIRESSVQTSSALEKETSRATKKIEQDIKKSLVINEGSYETHRGKVGVTTTKMTGDMQKEISTVSNKIEQDIKKSLVINEGNYETYKKNIGVVSKATSDVLVANHNQGLSKVGINTNSMITTNQNNWQIWGNMVGGISAETAKVLNANLNEGYRTNNSNTINFANANIRAAEGMGNGMVRASAQTAEGMNSNFNSSFSSISTNFVNLMKSMGEKISGFFSANKKLILTTAIVGGAVLGAGALALAVPAAIPYMASALGGLASIPALAKGGITDGPMLAMIGDNPGGREVVSPLDDLLGMITEAVSSTESNNNGSTNIVVKIGEDTILDKVVSGINRQSRINGETIITV